ncbi:hCG1725387, isoform CRA_a [Homo sapiens]|nr:PRO2834 [Homo sapiens]EAW54674.1 hCG1725387, isoform CRA_a [Homo sapiens]EAW54675.1 hCG1725387, isoform CRA_a [Homo sapiens]
MYQFMLVYSLPDVYMKRLSANIFHHSACNYEKFSSKKCNLAKLSTNRIGSIMFYVCSILTLCASLPCRLFRNYRISNFPRVFMKMFRFKELYCFRQNKACSSNRKIHEFQKYH